jgi:hypothetical protein
VRLLRAFPSQTLGMPDWQAERVWQKCGRKIPRIRQKIRGGKQGPIRLQEQVGKNLWWIDRGVSKRPFRMDTIH